jgi:small-conductance mechanosensitive channel
MNSILETLGLSLGDRWLDVLVASVVVVMVALIVHKVGAAVLRRLSRGMPLASSILTATLHPLRLVLPVLLLELLLGSVEDNLPHIGGVRHLTGLLLIAGLTWLASAAVGGLAEGVASSHPATVADNLDARRIQTQTRVFARVLKSIIVVIGLSLMIMTFPGARQFGTSLLASAGVAGLVAGLAARPAIGNLIAGMQIAITQPIRIDDVLIVQGEWGRVEEITGTYVVLRIWDERRLVIPLQWFIENPFQNWTRTSAQLIGSVFLWVDYRTPLQPLRDEARRVCEAAPEWDGRLCLLQVTDTSDRGMQLRVLVTSADSGRNWDLRCKVREGLIAYLQEHHAQALPRIRVSLDSPAQAAGATPVRPAGPEPTSPTG